MTLPSGINKFVEVENNENAIDNFKFLGEFESKGETDIEYIFDKEN